jgi:hypothetical protein
MVAAKAALLAVDSLRPSGASRHRVTEPATTSVLISLSYAVAAEARRLQVRAIDKL